MPILGVAILARIYKIKNFQEKQYYQYKIDSLALVEDCPGIFGSSNVFSSFKQWVGNPKYGLFWIYAHLGEKNG